MNQLTHVGAIAIGTLSTLALSTYTLAEHIDEEVLVVGVKKRLEVEVSSTDTTAPDSATMLRKLPGANINANGPITGVQQYRVLWLIAIITPLVTLGATR